MDDLRWRPGHKLAYQSSRDVRANQNTPAGVVSFVLALAYSTMLFLSLAKDTRVSSSNLSKHSFS